MPANSELTFGGLSRRQKCDAALLIFAGVLSTGLAVAMLVGTAVTETARDAAVAGARINHTDDVTLLRKAAAAPIAKATNTRPVVRASATRAVPRRRAEAAPRLVLASVSQPVSQPVSQSEVRADSGRNRFARLLLGDGGRHVVRPFPVIESTAEVR
jgi:hypothetical protein